MSPTHCSVAQQSVAPTDGPGRRGRGAHLRELFGEMCSPTCKSASPLLAAACKGQLVVVKYLLCVGADPMLSNCEGNNALHLACKNGHLRVVNALLAAAAAAAAAAGEEKRRSFVNASNRDGDSALSLAVSKQAIAIVEALLNHGADLEGCAGADHSPLLIACQCGRVDIMKLLIARGAKIDLPFKDRKTLLHCVADNGSPAVAEVLLDSGANVDALDQSEVSPLFGAVCRGRVAMTKLLVHRGAQASLKAKNGQSAMTVAATDGHLAIMEFFTSFYGREIVDQHRLLHSAVTGGFACIVEYLLTLNPDLEAKDQDGLTSLCGAICCLDMNMVALLVEHGADVHAKHVDNHNYSYLHIAAEVKNHDAIQFLISRGADVHAVDDQGGTALHVAAAVGAVNAVKVLIEHGGNVFAETNDGFCVTHAAASNGRLKVLKLLEQSGLTHDFEKMHPSNPTVTPLSLATTTTKGCKSGVVQYLIAYQDRQRRSATTAAASTSDDNSSQKIKPKLPPLTSSQRLYRSDALICAVSTGHLKTVKFLCAHGASIDLLEERGASALLTAAECGHVDILEYLLEEKQPVLDDVDYDGLAAIHYAAKNGHTRALELLLVHGASVDEPTDPLQDEEDDPRFTETVPLHFAATGGHFDAVKTLVRYGADLEIANVNGRRAVQLVRMSQSGSEIPGAVGFLLTNGTVDEYYTAES